MVYNLSCIFNLQLTGSVQITTLLLIKYFDVPKEVYMALIGYDSVYVYHSTVGNHLHVDYILFLIGGAHY